MNTSVAAGTYAELAGMSRSITPTGSDAVRKTARRNEAGADDGSHSSSSAIWSGAVVVARHSLPAGTTALWPVMNSEPTMLTSRKVATAHALLPSPATR